MPLTEEHQMILGEGEVKPTPKNPRRFSKKQHTILNFFRDRDLRTDLVRLMMIDTLVAGGGGGSGQTPSGIM